MIQPADSSRDFYSPEELAEALGVCSRTVKNMAKRGQLPRPMIRAGKVVRWHRRQFEILAEKIAVDPRG